MPVTATPIFAQTITNGVVVFNNTGTTPTTLYTAGSNGSRVESIFVTSTDSGSTYLANIFVTISATNYLIGTVTVPLSAGNTGTAPSINLFSSTGNFGTILNLDANGNPYLFLASGSILKVATTTTVTSGKNVTFFAMGGDY